MKKLNLTFTLLLILGSSLPTLAQIVKLELDTLNYDYILCLESGHQAIFKRELIGFANANRKEIVTPKYHTVSDFQEDRALVNYAGLFGFVDTKGKEVIPIQYDYATSFSGGLAIVKKDSLYGGIDKNGKTVIPFIYDYVAYSKYNDEVLRVRKDYKDLYINKKGERIFNFPYEEVKYAGHHRIMVKKDGFWGVVDNEGKVILPIQYKYLEPSEKTNEVNSWNDSESEKHTLYTAVKQLSKPTSLRLFSIAYLENLIPPEHSNHTLSKVVGSEKTNISSTTFGLMKAKDKQGKWGVLSMSGEIIIPFDYESLRYEGKSHLFTVKKNGKLGRLNKKNQLITPIIYDRFFYGSDTYRYRLPSQEIAVFDNYGKQVDFFNDGIYYLNENTHLINLGQCWKIVDKEGEEIIPLFSKLGSIRKNNARSCSSWGVTPYKIFLSIDGKHGAIDEHGKIIIPFEYDTLIIGDCSLVKAGKNNKYTIFNRLSQQVFPLSYNEENIVVVQDCLLWECEDWIIFKEDEIWYATRPGNKEQYSDKVRVLFELGEKVNLENFPNLHLAKLKRKYWNWSNPKAISLQDITIELSDWKGEPVKLWQETKRYVSPEQFKMEHDLWSY